ATPRPRSARVSRSARRCSPRWRCSAPMRRRGGRVGKNSASISPSRGWASGFSSVPRCRSWSHWLRLQRGAARARRAWSGGGRQFKEIKGLLEGKAEADSSRCVDIATRAALREMLAPGLLAVFVPFLVGVFFGVEALGGLLGGVTVCGALLALMMANAGGAWD